MKLMKTVTLFLALGIWFSLTIPGSPKDNADHFVYVKSMNISGLEHTRRSVVLRELTFNIPSRVAEQKIDEFKTRLTNLIIFKRVQTSYADSVLTLQIEEAPRYSIYPELSFIDRSWSKINYGFDFTHFNLYGDKIYLSLSAQMGYNPGFSFNIVDDWFTSKKIILGISAYSGKIQNKMYPFKETHHNVSILTGKRIRRDIYITVNNGIHFFSFPDKELAFFNKTDYFGKLYQAGISLLYDKRNYKFFPTRGAYLSASISTESIQPFEMQYKHYMTDIRAYFPFAKTSLGFRQYTHFSSQSLPIYDGVYLGFSERLRGYFFKSYYGKALLLHHMEYRFPLFMPRYYSYPSLEETAPDYFKSYFSNLYFGIYGSLFIENGMIENNYQSLNFRQSLTGYGFSLYFLLPFHNILRADLAVNDGGQWEYIIEGRVSF